MNKITKDRHGIELEKKIKPIFSWVLLTQNNISIRQNMINVDSIDKLNTAVRQLKAIFMSEHFKIFELFISNSGAVIFLIHNSLAKFVSYLIKFIFYGSSYNRKSK